MSTETSRPSRGVREVTITDDDGDTVTFTMHSTTRNYPVHLEVPAGREVLLTHDDLEVLLRELKATFET
jgi:hypothetical protein